MSQNSPTSAQPQLEKPFLIELWEGDKQPGGYFTPAAALHLTASLRTSGLLRELSPDDLKSLIYLLTFVSPEGHCQPFLTHLAEAMRVSTAKAKARMRRLCEVRWKGEPVVIYSKSASGLSAYSLNPRVVTYEHRHGHRHPREDTPYLTAPRAAIIEHSRKHYARPRAEVERIIAHQMGHDVDETDEERKVRYRLENAGLTGEQAKELLAMYDLDTIAQQLDWLPFRHAKNPAGYLIAAIEGNYGEPRAVRQERLFRELRYGEWQMQNDDSQSDGARSNDAHPDESNAEVSDDSGRTEVPDVGVVIADQTVDLLLPDDDADDNGPEDNAEDNAEPQ